MPYRYLDFTVAELIDRQYDVHFFCRCSRHAMLGPEDFARWPDSSLHGVASRMRCAACGATGDIPEVRLTATAARGGMGGAHIR